jgi:hypothetical protein
MSDEYLWDRSGEPDPLVADLEHKLEHLAFEPVFLVEEAAPASTPAPRASSWRGYFIGSAVTAAAVACSVLLYWCGYRAGVEAPPVDPGSQPVIVGAPEPARADEEPPPSVVEGIEADDEPVDDDEEEEAEPDPPRVADARDVKAKGKTKGKTGHKDALDGFPSTSSASSSTKSTSASSSKGSALDVDCILDPQACGKGTSSSSKPTSSGASDPSLPEKLSTTDIRDGMTPVKNAAKACGGKHGAESGDKVKVKLSIAGATGTVTSATVEAPHTGTPLGNCVEAAVKRARFKRFQKASLGAVYPITM